MNNIFKRALAIIFSALLFFVLLFTSIEAVVYNLSYYEWHYKNRNIDKDTGMSVSDLMLVTDKMINYLKDDSDNLDIEAAIDGEIQQVFGEREKIHMVDVKNLAVGMHIIRNFSVLIIVLIGIFSIKNMKWFIHILNTIKYVFLSLSLFILMISILLIIDFNKYFTIFHLIFFDNDLWLLDPKTDILINMVPEIFFFTTAMLVIVIFILLSVFTILIAELSKKNLKRKLW